MKKRCRNSLVGILILFVSALSISCDTWPGGEEEVADTDAAVAVSGSLALKASQTSVQSDDSDSATITATVLDTNNAVIEAVTVAFSSTGGELSASSVVTDTNGEAQATFSSGTTDRSNRVATITATVSGIAPQQIPVQITGSTMTLSADNTNLEVGGSDTATLTITVQDAGLLPIYGASVTVSVDTASTGVATLSPSSGTTDVSGQLEVEVTGTGAGAVTVNVQALGITASQAYRVGTVGGVFGITSPTDDPCSLSTNTDLTITVSAPTQTSVQFATTLGAWDGGTDMVVSKTVSGGSASAVLKSANAGVATVQVLDPADSSTTDSLKVAISAPSSEAFKIALQASATVVAPSITDVSNTVTLEATVKNASDEPVGKSAVAFSIENPTGGGETISPVIVYTDDYGAATSTFTSGSLSSGADGVTVKASVIGSTPAIEDSISIVIGGTAGSIIIGQGTTITAVNSDTAYQLPMSVMVSDSNGNPVSGAQVSLSLWPTQYATGYWTPSPGCALTYTGYFSNEDTNRNLILDAVEDVNVDGELTPPNSAAGSVPATVTTDDNGVANFNLIYLKISAAWIEVELTASTLVLGTETQSTYTFWLGWLVGEECNLPHSPYTAPLIADFTSTDVGDSDGVSFTDNSTTAAGSTITAWSWTFTGGTPSTSTAEDPGVVSFGAAGTYQVTLTVTNDLGIQDTEVKTVTVP